MGKLDPPAPRSRNRTPSRTTDIALRLFAVLELFTADDPMWTSEGLMSALGVGRPTVYRYVNTLIELGYLSLITRGRYMLGPRIIELDRHLRRSDPLIRCAEPIVRELRGAVAGGQLVCQLHGTAVMTVLEDRTDHEVVSVMERGRFVSLFHGAASRAILAYLPTDQLQGLCVTHRSEIAEAGLGEDWPSFREKMRATRFTGFVVSNEPDPQLTAIAAPIFRGTGTAFASLCLLRRNETCTMPEAAFLGELAADAAARITSALQAIRIEARHPGSTVAWS